MHALQSGGHWVKVRKVPSGQRGWPAFPLTPTQRATSRRALPSQAVIKRGPFKSVSAMTVQPAKEMGVGS